MYDFFEKEAQSEEASSPENRDRALFEKYKDKAGLATP